MRRIDESNSISPNDTSDTMHRSTIFCLVAVLSLFAVVLHYHERIAIAASVSSHVQDSKRIPAHIPPIEACGYLSQVSLVEPHDYLHS